MANAWVIDWFVILVIILIYISFLLDFVVWPIPSEASTAALLSDQGSAASVSDPLIRSQTKISADTNPSFTLDRSQQVLTLLAHAIVLMTWSYPLLFALWAATTLSGWLPFSGPDIDGSLFNGMPAVAMLGLGVACLGRLITIAASLTVKHGSARNVGIINYGVFAITRHPVVVGLHLTLIGLLIALGQWITVLPLIIVLGYFDYKTRLEEQALLRREDIDYAAYRREVGKYGWR